MSWRIRRILIGPQTLALLLVVFLALDVWCVVVRTTVTDSTFRSEIGAWTARRVGRVRHYTLGSPSPRPYDVVCLECDHSFRFERIERGPGWAAGPIGRCAYPVGSVSTITPRRSYSGVYVPTRRKEHWYVMYRPTRMGRVPRFPMSDLLNPSSIDQPVFEAHSRFLLREGLLTPGHEEPIAAGLAAGMGEYTHVTWYGPGILHNALTLAMLAGLVASLWMTWIAKPWRMWFLPPGHCRCGYDLTGLPADAHVCPECGRAITASNKPSRATGSTTPT